MPNHHEYLTLATIPGITWAVVSVLSAASGGGVLNAAWQTGVGLLVAVVVPSWLWLVLWVYTGGEREAGRSAVWSRRRQPRDCHR